LFNGKQNNTLDLIKSWLKKHDCKGPVLELGCGFGQYTTVLSTIGKVTAVDISNQMISLAKKLNSNQATQYIKSDMVSFVSESNQNFNTIAIIYSLFHLPLNNIYNLLPDIVNHINIGGYLILVIHEGNGVYINKKGVPYTLLSYSDISTTLQKLGCVILETNIPIPKQNVTFL